MQPIVSSARLGMVIFVAAEVMFFAGLIGAYLVFRLASPFWPPPGLPHLPLGVTSLNTLVLLASGATMGFSLRLVRAGSVRRLGFWLLGTATLGTAFLAIQGFEWTRLIRYGLTLQDGPYGGTFYTLIGFHGAHVLVAVVWLLGVFFAARRGRYSAEHHTGLEMCAIYWFFVCALWVFLFALVYP